MCQPTQREQKLADLLKEALEWVTAKPWDDGTFLHKRISQAIGEPIEYPDWDYGDNDEQ